MAADRKQQEVAVPMTADRALAEYPGMVTSIPEAEFDADGSGILAAALMATSWDKLNETMSTLPDAPSMAGRRIFVTGIGRIRSDLEGGLGWYLLVDYVDPATGEPAKFQTSAGSLMAKLVKLQQFVSAGTIGWPVELTVTKAVKATRSGFFPIDCTIHGVSKPALAAVPDEPNF